MNQILRNRDRNNGRLDVNGPKNDLFINLIGKIGEGNTSDGPNAGIAAPAIGNGIKAFVAEGTVMNGAGASPTPPPCRRAPASPPLRPTPPKGSSELAPPVAVTGNGGPCDRIRPRTRITGVRKNLRQGKVTVRFKSNEKSATFRCSRQRDHFRKCRSPKTFRRLPDGECHRIRVRAVDQAGNRDRTPAKVRICIPAD